MAIPHYLDSNIILSVDVLGNIDVGNVFSLGQLENRTKHIYVEYL